MICAVLLLVSAQAVAATTCSWDNPGHDPYTGTARAAIERMTTIPESVRAALIARAELVDYDDVVMIDRDSIRSKTREYEPEITFMAFGGRGRVCDRVDRSGWAPEHVESGMVFCESAWCILRPSVCNNWSIITRRPEATRPVEPAISPVPPVALDQPAVPLLAVPSGSNAPVTFDGPQGVGEPLAGPMVFAPLPPPPPPLIAFFPWPCVACAAPRPTPALPPISAVPEAPTWALMLAGAGLIASIAKKRKLQ